MVRDLAQPCLSAVVLGAGGVTVLSVGLQSGDGTLPLHADKEAVLECRFILDEGETIEELVWVREGRLLHSSNQAQDPGVEVSDFYNITNPDRNSSGVYSCTVRTQQGGDDTGKFELLVIDILSNKFFSDLNEKNCTYVLSFKTPYAYPRGSAFCGIWIPETQTENGTWLEPPPQRMGSDPMGASFRRSTPASKLSYSSERGDFNEAMDSEGRIQFSLVEKKIRVVDTPRTSSLKCTFGYYSPTGRYYPASSIESKSNVVGYNSSCLEQVPKKYITRGVSLQFSNYVRDCYGKIHKSWASEDLTATLRCDKSLEYKVLVCKDDVWQLQVHDILVKEYDNFLEEFVESCTSQHDEDDDDSGSSVALSASLGALSLVASLRRLRAL
ncbi:Immunoglobulin-like domain [Trinorchestia longiramus]|nr:Immunoglobulin-like domain [Trinorchestia longiramus]